MSEDVLSHPVCAWAFHEVRKALRKILRGEKTCSPAEFELQVLDAVQADLHSSPYSGAIPSQFEDVVADMVTAVADAVSVHRALGCEQHGDEAEEMVREELFLEREFRGAPAFLSRART